MNKLDSEILGRKEGSDGEEIWVNSVNILIS